MRGEEVIVIENQGKLRVRQVFSTGRHVIN